MRKIRVDPGIAIPIGDVNFVEEIVLVLVRDGRVYHDVMNLQRLGDAAGNVLLRQPETIGGGRAAGIAHNQVLAPLKPQLLRQLPEG